MALGNRTAKVAEPAQTVQPESIEQVTPSIIESKVTATPEVETAESSTSVEVIPTAKPAVTQPVSNGFSGDVIGTLSDMGFEGLDLDYSSFIGCVLKDGEFQFTSGLVVDKEGILVTITKTRPKYKYTSEGGEDAEVIYSYSKNAHMIPDSPVAEKVAEWTAAGIKLEKTQEYIEAICNVVGTMDDKEASQELIGQIIILSIPPTSKGRLSGFLATQYALNGLTPDKYVTHVQRGAKVTNTAFAFYPWAFSVYAEKH